MTKTQLVSTLLLLGFCPKSDNPNVMFFFGAYGDYVRVELEKHNNRYIVVQSIMGVDWEVTVAVNAGRAYRPFTKYGLLKKAIELMEEVKETDKNFDVDRRAKLA